MNIILLLLSFLSRARNSARWTAVFLKNMARLPESHPNIHEAFMKGMFVMQRGDKKFFLMALDISQAHRIRFLKEESGTKGLNGQKEEKELIQNLQFCEWLMNLKTKVYIHQARNLTWSILSRPLQNSKTSSNI